MTASPDPFDLQRFVDAQDPVYTRAIDELRHGRKASHWMWFIFPQLRGLGHSAMAQHYGIASLYEARAFLAHPLLGARLRECLETLLGLEDLSAHDIFGSPDDAKLRSCLTLFERAAPEDPLFARVIDRYFAGERDPLTLSRLGA